MINITASSYPANLLNMAYGSSTIGNLPNNAEFIIDAYLSNICDSKEIRVINLLYKEGCSYRKVNNITGIGCNEVKRIEKSILNKMHGISVVDILSNMYYNSIDENEKYRENRLKELLTRTTESNAEAIVDYEIMHKSDILIPSSNRKELVELYNKFDNRLRLSDFCDTTLSKVQNRYKLSKYETVLFKTELLKVGVSINNGGFEYEEVYDNCINEKIINAWIKSGIKTFEDLSHYTENEIKSIYPISGVYIATIKYEMLSRGYKFRTTEINKETYRINQFICKLTRKSTHEIKNADKLFDIVTSNLSELQNKILRLLIIENESYDEVATKIGLCTTDIKKIEGSILILIRKNRKKVEEVMSALQ